ncbi:MAG: RnfH family protein [bacterium]
MKVEVVYALHDEQTLLELEVEEGNTVEQAVRQSGILSMHPEIDLGVNKVGIFGHATKLDTVLQPGDRVEIYRPITCDPKEVRRERAALAKKAKKEKA